MPVTYLFEDRILIVECRGEYSPAELESAWDQAVQDPRFNEGTEVCLDVRESASLAQRSTRDLRRTSNWFAAQAAMVNHRCALLTRPGIQFGLMRMASVWVGFKGTAAGVFTDRDKAFSWLNEIGGRKSESR